MGARSEANSIAGCANIRRTIFSTRVLALSLFCVACASEGFPPGGPEDLSPPVLVETSPADRAVNAAPEQAIRLLFDEVIDDRQLGDLPRLVRVNPDVPDFDIILEESIITLSPETPMADGVTYSVTLLPGLQDRAGNATVEPRTILFSVGGEEMIPLSIVRATILRDTVPAAGAFYRLENDEAGLAYTAVADSQGFLELEAVEYGRYVATAWLEQAGADEWDMTEEPGARDTFDLSLENRLHETTYRIAVVDTTPPVVEEVATPEGARIVVTTDDRLPERRLTPEAVRLYAGSPGLADRGVPLDSLPLEDVRAVRIPVASVQRTTPSELQIVPAAPLRRGEVYRIEIPGVENEALLAATPGTGLTFVADYEGTAILPSEPIAWPDVTDGADVPQDEP